MNRYVHIAAPLAAPLVFLLALLLAGCANKDIKAAENLKIDGNTMADEAAREYRRMAMFENKVMWDRASAQAFSEKALAAADGQVQLHHDDAVSSADAADIAQAYAALAQMLALGGGDMAPKAAGQAIARLDCWAEQASEGDQPRHIGFCRDGFKAYADETATTLAAGGRAPDWAMPLKSFAVTFALGSAEPDAKARQVIDQAARYARAKDGLRIVLGGHADRSGTARRNQQISAARAKTVADLLREAGIRNTEISTIAFGETYPKNRTPDGQRSAENRRVEIVIGPARIL
tara:strand:+ start:77394 stop:78266 length:873 start_codon:yes stop_codon:yes gene_type:complete